MARTPAFAPSNSFPPPASHSYEAPRDDCAPSDSSHLFESAITGLSEALHLLHTSPLTRANLQHAIDQTMRGAHAIEHLATLCPETAPDWPASHSSPTLQVNIPPKIRSRRRRFDPQYKREVALLIRQHKHTISQVCKKLNLAYSVVHRWLIEFDIQQATSHSAGQIPSSNLERIDSLQERLEQLQQDNELLKKAAAFFARQ